MGPRQTQELVLKVLRIQDFTGLEITKAHRYIAYLVRESVIEEVITSITISAWKEPIKSLWTLITLVKSIV